MNVLYRLVTLVSIAGDKRMINISVFRQGYIDILTGIQSIIEDCLSGFTAALVIGNKQNGPIS